MSALPQQSSDDVTVTFDFIEAMGTLAALRAVIDSAPVRPDKLITAERKLAAATRTKESR